MDATTEQVTTESIFGKREPLHPDLVEELKDIPQFGLSLRHPLVFSIPHFAGLNAYVNKRYEQKRKAVDLATKQKDWSAVIMMHERPYRFSALESIQHEMDDAEFWRQFGWCWIDCENLWQYREAIRHLFRLNRPQRHMMMDEEERTALTALPDQIEVHRGHEARNARGMSWTLDHDRAVWFATRFEQKGFVTSGVVLKKDVIAHFKGRHENEIVCFSNDVKHKRRESVRKI